MSKTSPAISPQTPTQIPCACAASATIFRSRTTPGFHAGKVQFENALQSAIANGASPDAARPTVAQSLEPTQLNGNNVNLDEETLSNVDTGLRYQLALHAMDSKFGLISDVIKGGGA